MLIFTSTNYHKESHLDLHPMLYFKKLFEKNWNGIINVITIIIGWLRKIEIQSFENGNEEQSIEERKLTIKFTTIFILEITQITFSEETFFLEHYCVISGTECST